MHPHIHQDPFRGCLEIPNTVRADHIGDLMGITNRGGHAAWGHAAVKLERGHKARFHMEMGINKARNQGQACDINCLDALIGLANTDNHIPADRDIACDHAACDQVKNLPAAQNQISGGIAAPL